MTPFTLPAPYYISLVLSLWWKEIEVEGSKLYFWKQDLQVLEFIMNIEEPVSIRTSCFYLFEPRNMIA